MINLILKDLVLWLFGLFLDLMNYCADALLGLMNTDLAYFESNVPIILKLYGVFVAIGWGFLISTAVIRYLNLEEFSRLKGISDADIEWIELVIKDLEDNKKSSPSGEE